MALPNKLATQLSEPLIEPLVESDQQAAAACLLEIQAVLENIRQTRAETEQVRAAAEPLLDQLLQAAAQRLLVRQDEIRQFKAENELLQARLLAA